MRDVRSWVQRANRDYKMPIEWHVRLVDAGRSGRGAAVKLKAVDPKTDVQLGDEFVARIAKPLERRIDEYAQRTLIAPRTTSS